MEDKTRNNVSRAMAFAVQAMLERNHAAVIPGLGTFSIRYDQSRCERQEDGSTVIVPPSRELLFRSEQVETATNG